MDCEIRIIKKCTCTRCGYSWFPRYDKIPVHCARCNSPYWNNPYKKKI